MESASVQAPTESAKLKLSGDCCIEALAQQHEYLLQALDGGVAVELDLSAVSRMDTAGLQLVLVFFVEMKRQGRGVSIRAASESFKQCAMSAGVAELLGL